MPDKPTYPAPFQQMSVYGGSKATVTKWLSPWWLDLAAQPFCFMVNQEAEMVLEPRLNKIGLCRVDSQPARPPFQGSARSLNSTVLWDETWVPVQDMLKHPGKKENKTSVLEHVTSAKNILVV